LITNYAGTREGAASRAMKVNGSTAGEHASSTRPCPDSAAYETMAADEGKSRIQMDW
jgi:hypothetical protein